MCAAQNAMLAVLLAPFAGVMVLAAFDGVRARRRRREWDRRVQENLAITGSQR